MKKLFMLCALAAAILAVGSARSARATTLADLLTPGASIVHGDKKFHSFSYLATGDMPGAGAINVLPFTDTLGQLGLRFQGGFLDTPVSAGASDALISFVVDVLDPTRDIIGVYLYGNPTIVGPLGSVSVSETFVPDDPHGISVFDNHPGSHLFADSATLSAPLHRLHVQKDILAFAGPESFATMSFVDQTFAQTRGATTPEPGTMTLLGLGGAALFGKLRRRKQQVELA